MREVEREKVEAATVHLPANDGLGILAPGQFILTAAHCVSWSSEGGMALGDHHIEAIETPDGNRLIVEPYAVEPLCDIAVLGAPDNQAFGEEAEAFEEFCESTPGVPLCLDEFDSGSCFPVHIFTNKREWTTGQAARVGLWVGGTLAINPDSYIEGGTSGGPIVNDQGELVALTSTFGSVPAFEGTDRARETYNMRSPRPHLAMPGWLWARISRAMQVE